jgi:acyl-coenzyme A thioesterase PaaI-like protein
MACPAPVSAVAPPRDDIVPILLLQRAIVRKLRTDHSRPRMESPMSTGPADGLAPLFRTSPFLDRIGPFYSKGKGARMVVGLRALEQHMNARGLVHGGVLMTLADIALG